MNDAANYVAGLGKIYYSFSKQTNLWFCTWQTIKQTKKILENIIFWKDRNIIET